MGVYTRSWLKLFLPAHHKSPEDNSYPTISAILTKPLRLYRVLLFKFIFYGLPVLSTAHTGLVYYIYIFKKTKTKKT